MTELESPLDQVRLGEEEVINVPEKPFQPLVTKRRGSEGIANFRTPKVLETRIKLDKSGGNQWVDTHIRAP